MPPHVHTDHIHHHDTEILDDGYNTAVAWPAIIAGALVAATVSLTLMLLGTGLGLASISPWANAGASATAFTAGAASWLLVMQWAASGLGGYLTGRLRSKWRSMHTHEVFFRDTAHGFLAWALATLLTAICLTSTIGAIIGGGASVAAHAVAGAAAAPDHHGPAMDRNVYLIDSLFRAGKIDPATPAPQANAEATRILLTDLKEGEVSADDRAYLTRLVAARTGISEADAAKRVDDVIARMEQAKEDAKAAADKARRAASRASIFIFLSLLVGAFVASASAAVGGRHRDEF